MTMIELTGRDAIVVLKALVLASQTIQRQPQFRRPDSDLRDMQRLIDRLGPHPADLEPPIRSAFWILDGHVPSAK